MLQRPRSRRKIRYPGIRRFPAGLICRSMWFCVLFGAFAQVEIHGQADPSLELRFEEGYTTNVVALGKDVPLPGDISRERSFYSRSSIEGSLQLYEIQENPVRLGNRLVSDAYQESSGLNVLTNLSFVDYRHEFGADWTGAVGLSYEISRLGGRNFRSRSRLEPTLVYRFLEWGALEIAYAVDRSEYFLDSPAVQDRDGRAGTARIGGHWRLPGSELTGQLGYFHVDNRAEGSDFDFRSNGLIAGLRHPLPHEMTVEIFYTRTFDRFRNRHSFAEPGGFAFRRRDDVNVLSAQLVLPVYGWLKGYVRSDFTDANSNIDFFEYDQRVVSFGFVATIW